MHGRPSSSASGEVLSATCVRNTTLSRYLNCSHAAPLWGQMLLKTCRVRSFRTCL